MDDSGVLGLVALLAIGGGALVVGTGIYLYASDYVLTADVTDKECHGPSSGLLNTVSVKTRAFGIDRTVAGIGFDQCQIVGEGDYVEYHIRTKRTTLYDADGSCLYDTETGAFCGQGAPAGLLS